MTSSRSEREARSALLENWNSSENEDYQDRTISGSQAEAMLENEVFEVVMFIMKADKALRALRGFGAGPRRNGGTSRAAARLAPKRSGGLSCMKNILAGSVSQYFSSHHT